MPEQLLIENCSPTLAGMKPSNLISLPYPDLTQARADIREMNRIFVRKGLRAVPMNYRKGRVLLYLYRPEHLQRVLQQERVRAFLTGFGYDCDDMARCIAQLSRRIRARKSSDEFPHEIGIFLGYPLEDVEGFINHKEEGCKTIGTWKVYGDVEQAEASFRRFRRCTTIYQRAWAQGRTLEELTVAS